jgi:hypothetical protein
MQETWQQHGQQGQAVTQVVMGGYIMIVSGGSCPRAWGCAGKCGSMVGKCSQPTKIMGDHGDRGGKLPTTC